MQFFMNILMMKPKWFLNQLFQFLIFHYCLFIRYNYKTIIKKRVTGIEPVTPAWKAGVLPLNYTRMTLHLSECLLWGTQPNILTVCNGVRQGSSLNIQRGLIPNLQDSDGPVAEWHLWLERLKFLTPLPGIEPGTTKEQLAWLGSNQRPND